MTKSPRRKDDGVSFLRLYRSGPQGRELAWRGTPLFPPACYHDDLTQTPVPWHWHDELEALVIESGTVRVRAGAEVYTLKAGDGCFINAGVLHDIRQDVRPNAQPQGAQRKPSEKSLRDAERVKTMLQTIHQRYAQELTLADVAQSAAVSPNECLRCFKSVTGSTPVQYIRHFRIEKAAELLRGTDQNISDVAAACGFSDASYFSKTFRLFKGCTPAAFRKQNALQHRQSDAG